jgi:hypothetical protein
VELVISHLLSVVGRLLGFGHLSRVFQNYGFDIASFANCNLVAFNLPTEEVHVNS